MPYFPWLLTLLTRKEFTNFWGVILGYSNPSNLVELLGLGQLWFIYVGMRT